MTRIDHVSILSGLNQLDDISMSDSYSAICGITYKELIEVLSEEINSLAERNGVTREETLSRLKTIPHELACDDPVIKHFALLVAQGKKHGFRVE